MDKPSVCLLCGKVHESSGHVCDECIDKTLELSRKADAYIGYFESHSAVITADLLASTPADDWVDLAYHCASRHLELSGCWQAGGPNVKSVLSELPLGIQMAYRIASLDCEVVNGGFAQWLTNSSGQHTAETLEDLLRLQSFDAAAVVQQVLRLNSELEVKYRGYRQRFGSDDETSDEELQAYWEDMAQIYEPQFDELRSLLPDVTDAASPNMLLAAYLVAHPELLTTV